MPEDEVGSHTSSVDVMCYLHFLDELIILFKWLSGVALVIILPVTLTGTGGRSWYEATTLLNIKCEPARLW